MGSIDPAKILVVLVVALIVLGPQKLPDMARHLGKLWGDFRRFREGLEAEVRGAFGDDTTGAPVDYLRNTVSHTFSGLDGAPPGLARGDGAASSDIGSSSVPAPGLPDPTPGEEVVRAAGDLSLPPNDPSLN